MSEHFIRQQPNLTAMSRPMATKALELMIEDLKAHASQKRGPKRFTPAELEASRARVLEAWTW